jgi:hypothetical protein
MRSVKEDPPPVVVVASGCGRAMEFFWEVSALDARGLPWGSKGDLLDLNLLREDFTGGMYSMCMVKDTVPGKKVNISNSSPRTESRAQVLGHETATVDIFFSCVILVIRMVYVVCGSTIFVELFSLGVAPTFLCLFGTEEQEQLTFKKPLRPPPPKQKM